MEHLARERGVSDRLRVASAGTGGWHAGEAPDARARAAAARRGVQLSSRAQQVDPARHFAPLSGGYEWIIPMDRSNRADLLRLGAAPERVRLLRSFDPALAGASDAELDVPDPYGEGEESFDRVFTMIRAGCAGLLDVVVGEGTRHAAGARRA